MKRLLQIVPDLNTVLAMEPAEIAEVVLEQLRDAECNGERGMFHVYAYCNQALAIAEVPQTRDDVVTALAEALSWLTSHGFVAPRPDSAAHGWFFVTKLGKTLGGQATLKAFRKAGELPKERLHEAIAEQCHDLYIRGMFDTAVFEAYKTLEVSIREAARLPPGLIGNSLARKAFDVANGPLTDLAQEAGERQALSDLMAGALGSYKNPHSHRRVQLLPEEAVEMITLASHLLRIVDSRRLKEMGAE